MVMRLKDVGKLPHAKIQPWQQQQQQQQRSVGNSVASSQPRSPPPGTVSPPLGSTTKKRYILSLNDIHPLGIPSKTINKHLYL